VTNPDLKGTTKVQTAALLNRSPLPSRFVFEKPRSARLSKNAIIHRAIADEAIGLLNTILTILNDGSLKNISASWVLRTVCFGDAAFAQAGFVQSVSLLKIGGNLW
jgi:hypothetical protein